MKSLELLEIVEDLLRGNDVSQKRYDKACWIVESILVNHWIKHLIKEDVFNQLLMKLFERKDSYNFELNKYQKRNYITRYLHKAMQEIIQTEYNIIDVSMRMVETGEYTSEVYEPYPNRFFAEDFHEDVEKDLLLEWLKIITTPKECFALQRIFIDWVKKKEVAKELKVSAKQISSILNKIKEKAATAFQDKY